jgi:hypothetical protein
VVPVVELGAAERIRVHRSAKSIENLNHKIIIYDFYGEKGRRIFVLFSFLRLIPFPSVFTTGR